MFYVSMRRKDGRKQVCCRFERLSTTIRTHHSTTQRFSSIITVDLFGEVNKVFNSYLKQLIAEGSLSKSVNGRWSHQREIVQESLNTRHPRSSFTPKRLVHPHLFWLTGQWNPTFIEWKSQHFVSLKLQRRILIFCLPEGKCSLSIDHVISIGHWRATIKENWQFLEGSLFLFYNRLSNHAKTTICLRLSKYWWIFTSTSSRGIFNIIKIGSLYNATVPGIWLV